jgi:ribosomal protein L40E
MPFCPICKTEYVAGVSVCSDCDVPLVDKLPPADPAEPDVEFVVLTEGQTEVVTDVLQAELEAAGIQNYVSGDTLQTMKVYPAWNAKVWVAKDQLELAKEILNEVLTGPPLEDDADLEGKVFCDACGAEVPPDATVCPECGEPLGKLETATVCDACGAEVPPDAKVCPACGKKFES